MLISYQWLSELVDLEGISAQDIAEKLNLTGIEVEYTRNPRTDVSGVVVGNVLSTEKHPEADRLRICKVDVGESSPLQIICGAPNVAAGQKVPVAVVGAELPDLKIKRAKLRGIESYGMICSAKELGLEEKFLAKEQTEGIFVLGDDATIGQDIRDYLGLDDQVIELQLTPNRSDCLGMIGVAYEIAAVFNRPLLFSPSTSVDIEASLKVNVRIEHEEDCPFYAGQVVSDLSLGETSQWMKNRLIASGIRPINNIVDVTNYVMIETGQPLHAFDFGKIEGGEIEVMRAQQGETVVTLDGVTRALDHETILIKNKDKILAIAGIMGGNAAEVTSDTTTVLLESAFFDPAVIRRTSRKIGLRSEASSRFEKGIDPEKIIPALHRAVQLLQQMAGGKIASPIVGKKLTKVEDITIPLRHKRVNQVLGIHIDSNEILEIFKRLHFPTTYIDDTFHVQIPTRRADVLFEVDLIEEVARLFGYHQIPATPLWGQQTPGSLTLDQKRRRIIRHTLRTLGMSEVITYSLTSPALEKLFHPNSSSVRVMNPLSKERSVLRASLLPHLVETASYNHNQQQKPIALFEMGRVYVSQAQERNQLPEEQVELAGIFTQSQEADLWVKERQESGFYSVKGILHALFQRLGIGTVEYTKAIPEGFHPGRTAHIRVNGDLVGVIGELHPQIAKQYDLPRTVVFQLNLTKMDPNNEQVCYHAFARFPAVSRDLAVVVENHIPAGHLEREIKRVGGSLLESILLFDVYTGEQVGQDKKSLAFSLVYRGEDRTLTEEEVSLAHQKIVDHLVATLAAKQRD